MKVEIERNKYRIQKRKLYASRNKNTDEDDDDVEDFIESLPKWLSSIAEGANIDLEGLYEGDPDELRKVRDILDKNLPKLTQGSPGQSSSLEGSADNPIR